MLPSGSRDRLSHLRPFESYFVKKRRGRLESSVTSKVSHFNRASVRIVEKKLPAGDLPVLALIALKQTILLIVT